MAYYAYKAVVHRIPQEFTAMVDGYEGDANYNGDAWIATSHWIDALEARIKELETQAEADRALMKIGAALWCDGIESALDTLYAAGRALGQTLADRARELAQEGQDG